MKYQFYHLYSNTNYEIKIKVLDVAILIYTLITLVCLIKTDRHFEIDFNLQICSNVKVVRAVEFELRIWFEEGLPNGANSFRE